MRTILARYYWVYYILLIDILCIAYLRRLSSKNAFISIKCMNDGNGHDTKDIVYSEPSTSLSRRLDDLKLQSRISKWRSSISYARPMSSTELYELSRQSFGSRTYFDDILKSMDTAAKQDNVISVYVVSCIIDIMFGSIIVPTLTLPLIFKNILGVVTLSYPFIVAFIGFIAPNYILNISDKILSIFQRSDSSKKKERIVYHEAGHILVGYLCGVGLQSYSIDGDVLSHAAVDIDQELLSLSLNLSDEKLFDNDKPSITLGNLILVAMAGVVAETLRFGDCKGGVQDFLLAQSLLRTVKVSQTNYIEYLRWSVGKCLSLLRLNRNALDELADAIYQNKTIEECYRIIEETVD